MALTSVHLFAYRFFSSTPPQERTHDVGGHNAEVVHLLHLGPQGDGEALLQLHQSSFIQTRDADPDQLDPDPRFHDDPDPRFLDDPDPCSQNYPDQSGSGSGEAFLRKRKRF